MASGPPRKKARLLQHLGSDEQMSVLALHNPTLVETAASAWSWADPFRTRGFAALMPEILATIYTYLTEQQQFIASAASKHWRLALYHQVRTMAINGEHLGRRGKDTFVRELSVLRALRHLSLTHCAYLSTQALTYLLPLEHLKSLTLIACTQMDLRGLITLAQLRGLEELRLEGSLCRVLDPHGRGRPALPPETDPALAHLLDRLAALRRLALIGWALGRAGLEEVAKRPLLELDLSEWRLGVGVPAALAALNPLAAALEALTLRRCGITPAHLTAFDKFHTLKRLDLRGNRIGSLAVGGVAELIID